MSQLPSCCSSDHETCIVIDTAAYLYCSVGGNWKCNGSVTAVSTLVTDLNASSSQVPPGIDLVVVPPFVYLDYVVSHLDKEKYQVSLVAFF